MEQPTRSDCAAGRDMRDLLPSRLLRQFQDSLSDLVGLPASLLDARLIPLFPEPRSQGLCMTLSELSPKARCKCSSGAEPPAAPAVIECFPHAIAAMAPVSRGETVYGYLRCGPFASPGAAAACLEAAAEKTGAPPGVIETAAGGPPRECDRSRLESVATTLGLFGSALGAALAASDFALLARETVGESRSAPSSSGKEFLKSLLDGTRACISACGMDGVFTAWSRFGEQFLGYRTEEVVGRMEPKDIIDGPDRFPLIRRVVESDGYFEEEIQAVAKDGRRKSARLIVSPQIDDSGRQVGYVMVNLDASEYVEIKRLYEKSRERTEALLETLPDAFYQTDALGRLVYINASGARLLGYSKPQDLIGMDIGKELYSDPGQRELFLRKLSESGGVVMNWVTQLWHASGRKVWISAHSRFMRDNSGKVCGVEGVVRDITELIEAESKIISQMEELERAYDKLKQAQTSLVHSEKRASLGNLLAGIAHEINNPVNFVRGNLSFMERTLAMFHPTKFRTDSDAATFEDFKGALADARKGADRIVDIIDTLRRFTRPGHGIGSDRFDLSASVIEAARLNEAAFKGKAKLVSELDRGLEVVGDRSLLGQVWMNLIQNAFQAAPEGGRVEVRVFAHSDEAVVRVTDDGPGIPEPIRDRIFDPFVTMKPDGMGLGLSLSFDIVTRHGGEIGFETADGGGTVFEVRLPLVPPQTPHS